MKARLRALYASACVAQNAPLHQRDRQEWKSQFSYLEYNQLTTPSQGHVWTLSLPFHVQEIPASVHSRCSLCRPEPDATLEWICWLRRLNCGAELSIAVRNQPSWKRRLGVGCGRCPSADQPGACGKINNIGEVDLNSGHTIFRYGGQVLSCPRCQLKRLQSRPGAPLTHI